MSNHLPTLNELQCEPQSDLHGPQWHSLAIPQFKIKDDPNENDTCQNQSQNQHSSTVDSNSSFSTESSFISVMSPRETALMETPHEENKKVNCTDRSQSVIHTSRKHTNKGSSNSSQGSKKSLKDHFETNQYEYDIQYSEQDNHLLLKTVTIERRQLLKKFSEILKKHHYEEHKNMVLLHGVLSMSHWNLVRATNTFNIRKKWLNTFYPHLITEKQVLPQLCEAFPGKFHGRDKHGRPILYLELCKFNVKDRTYSNTDMIKCVVYMIERQLKSNSLPAYPYNGMVILMNMFGFSFKHNFDQKLFKQIGDLFWIYYPGVVSSVYMFQSDAKVTKRVKSMLKHVDFQIVGNMFHIIKDNDKVLNTLVKSIDLTQLPKNISQSKPQNCPIYPTMKMKKQFKLDKQTFGTNVTQNSSINAADDNQTNKPLKRRMSILQRSKSLFRTFSMKK